MKYTPETITSLKPNEVFVFGSNESGIHGAGAAKFAYEKLGAVWGHGFGMQGNCFAIPTKDWEIQTLPIEDIAFYVRRFLTFADLHRKNIFLVTKLGCGLAGMTINEVAPLFDGAEKMKNIILPKEFADFLK